MKLTFVENMLHHLKRNPNESLANDLVLHKIPLLLHELLRNSLFIPKSSSYFVQKSSIKYWNGNTNGLKILLELIDV